MGRRNSPRDPRPPTLDEEPITSMPRFSVQAPMSSVPFGDRMRLIEEYARTLKSTMVAQRCDLNAVYAAKREEEETLADEEVRQASVVAADVEVQGCMSDNRQRLLFRGCAGPVVAIEAAVAQRSYTPTSSARGPLLDRTTYPERRSKLSEVCARESAWDSEASKRRQQKLFGEAFGAHGGATIALEAALGSLSSSGRRSRMATPQAWTAQGPTETAVPADVVNAESLAEERLDHPIVSSSWRPSSRSSQYSHGSPRGQSSNSTVPGSRPQSRNSQACVLDFSVPVQTPVGHEKAIPVPAKLGDTLEPPSLTEPAAGVPKPATLIVRPRSALGTAGNIRARLGRAEWKATRNCKNLGLQRCDLDLVLEARRRQEEMLEGLAV